MQLISERNMHDALPRAMDLLRQEGLTKGHRTVVEGPVAITVALPVERLSYGTCYDLNPFATLFTALWVLGARNDVAFLAKFDGYHMGTSDDGKVLNGAYGKRIRDHFWVAENPDADFPPGQIDQLRSVMQMLKNKGCHNSAVISLWDAGTDLGLLSQDLPPATHLYLRINHNQRLDMMVVYRDADIFGLHLDSIIFSMMQEFIAASIPIPLGQMTIVVNSLGVDTKILEDAEGIPPVNPYHPLACLVPIATIDSDTWLGELSMFLDEGPVMGMRDSFFRHVAAPMWQAWGLYQSTTGLDVHGARKALDTISCIRASDWQGAATEWLLRNIDERMGAIG